MPRFSSLRISRRTVLKTMGVTAGILTAAPLLSGLDDGSLGIGLLLPRSEIYPALGENLTAGMQLYFDRSREQDNARKVQLRTETITYDSLDALRKSKQLAQTGPLDFVVAVTGARVAAQLGSFFQTHHIPLIVNRMGANVFSPDWHTPFVINNSLSLWQANRAMGAWVAQHLGKRAYVVRSFYESMYDMGYAFRTAFEAAGGRIVASSTTHSPYVDRDLVPLMKSIESSRPDFVYGFYNGQQAGEFVRAYADAGLAGRIPLAGSAFMVDESILSTQGDIASGIMTALPWAGGLNSAGNTAFMNAYQQATGREADAFAVLGYDTAQLIAHADRDVLGNLLRANRLAEALDHAEISSPRGSLSVLAPLQQLGGPIYLREVRWQNGAWRNVVIDQLETTSSLDAPIAATRARQQSGLLNPYLAV